MKRTSLTLIGSLALLIIALLLLPAPGRAETGRPLDGPTDFYFPLVMAQAGANQPPLIPTDPAPPDGATGQNRNVDLAWSGGDPDGDAVTYDLYLEADDPTPDVQVAAGHSDTIFDPGTLAANTHYYWRVVAEDEGGLVREGSVWDFTTGSEASDSELFLTLEPPQVNDLTVTMSGAVTATNSSIIRLNWRWGDGDSGDQWFPAVHTYTISSTYLITATAYDDLGNTAVVTTPVQVDDPGSEIFLILEPPQVSDLTVMMSGTVTATNSAITRLNWQWGDGASGDQWFPAMHTYTVGGTYPITATAYDDLGNTAVVTTAVQVAEAESEIFLNLEPPQVNDLTVTMSGTVTATNSAITRLNWQWGDGASGGQWFPAVHTYTISGTYPITATAYDDLGNTAVVTTAVQLGETTRVSVAGDGSEGNALSWDPAVSANGRFVAFGSSASNLVSNDTNGFEDVFVHDRQTGETTRVSVASDGTEANHESHRPSISADGRFIVFMSYASNLVPDDTNGGWDVFLHDRQTGETTRVSLASDGMEGNGGSWFPFISATGRFVTFMSTDGNLVPGEANGYEHIFVHDRQTGETVRVSVANDGTQANQSSYYPSISDDGRFVAFNSFASNLVPGDTNATHDIFVHDRQTGETTRVSVASDGMEGNGLSARSSISGDGRFVAFDSEASNLVPGDANGEYDIFVHDRQTGETRRVSVAGDGTEGDGGSSRPSLATDGRFIAFDSDTSNLVPNDTNGASDIFIHDRQTGETIRVSLADNGTEGNGYSGEPSLSDNGRFVSFVSGASNLVPDDTNGYRDIFVRDRGPQ